MGRSKSDDALSDAQHTARHRRKLVQSGGSRTDLKLGADDTAKAHRLMAKRGVTLTALVAQLIREANAG